MAAAFLDGSVRATTRPGCPTGCLGVQGALATGDPGSDARDALTAWRNEHTSLLRDRFRQAVDEGDLPSDADPEQALPLLNDGASVILNSSVRADDGVAAFGTYAVSKAAIRSFARTWANELKGRGIRVNAISPGTIDTPGLDAVAAGDTPLAKSQFAAGVPLGRIGRPDEVAEVVAFLASGQSGFILGANLYVDGGENQI
ncbi:SDR family oxidoreductase [Streptomyces mirabilis]|uniref:SDR family oxidoreductase n=1 Tax=Streptomyces mirabilis TaxID=68239 RepID=UPI0036D19722